MVNKIWAYFFHYLFRRVEEIKTTVKSTIGWMKNGIDKLVWFA